MSGLRERIMHGRYCRSLFPPVIMSPVIRWFQTDFVCRGYKWFGTPEIPNVRLLFLPRIILKDAFDIDYILLDHPVVNMMCTRGYLFQSYSCVQFVDLNCELGFDPLHHQILSNRFELVADICIIPLSTPLLLQQLQRLFQDLWWTDNTRVGCSRKS